MIISALSIGMEPVTATEILMTGKTVTDVSVVLQSSQLDCIKSSFRQCRFKDANAQPVPFVDFKWDQGGQLQERNIWLLINQKQRNEIFEKMKNAFGNPFFQKGDISSAVVVKWKLSEDEFVSFVHDMKGKTTVRRGYGKTLIIE